MYRSLHSAPRSQLLAIKKQHFKNLIGWWSLVNKKSTKMCSLCRLKIWVLQEFVNLVLSEIKASADKAV